MARKDEILKSFLNHELLLSKYGIQEADIPTTVYGALNSDKALVKAIGLIVEGLESKPAVTDTELRNQITRFLNEAI